jgi:hypothetical protein
MTPHQMLIVAVRLFAIFVLLGSLGQIALSFSTYRALGEATYFVWVWLALQLAVSAWLWLFPATIAAKLLRPGSVPAQAPTAFSEWRDLCFIAIGMFILCRAIPDLVYWLILAAAIEPGAELTLEQNANGFVTLLEVVIGIGLMLGATGIAAAIERLRSAGTGSKVG